MRSLGWTVLLIAACDASGAGSSTSLPFQPDAITSGTYALTVTTDTDSCTPAREQLQSVPVEVQHDPQGLVLRIAHEFPGGTSSDAFTLADADGYAARAPAEGQHIDPCPGSGDSVVISRTLVGADATTIVVDEDQTWQIAAACPSAASFGGSLVPTASCHASRTLTYVKR